MYSIILVHIGDTFIEYINDCIEQIKKFNNCDIYVACHESHRNNISNSDIYFISIESLIPNNKHIIFNNTTQLNKNFRNGFWKFATERFFILENIMQKFNLTNVFHIENDNLLYCNLTEYLTIFENEYDIAGIFDNDDRCIPGFLYFKNINSISNLTYFILNNNESPEIEIFNPSLDDMRLLAKYKTLTNRIKNLPILPSNYDLEFRLPTIDSQQYFTNIHKFNSLFDGAAIGQYLGGVDPRNKWWHTIGFINENCIFDVSKFEFTFHLDNKNRKIPFLIYKNQKVKINNLHIHSKNLKYFM